VDGTSVTFDIPTLSFAVNLVMLMASLSLTAHWLANRGIYGLREIAFGVIAFSLGSSCLFFPGEDASGAIQQTAGHLLVLAGHMWVWVGVSDFWQMRQKQQILFGRLLVVLAVFTVIYQLATNANSGNLTTTSAVFVAIMSAGIVRTLVQALGGSTGFYKGIIRRTTVGVGLAAGLFALHAIFNVFQAFAGDTTVLSFISSQAASHLEALIFVIVLALVVIIMTAERLQAELRIQEMMDPLTRALNRRAFLEVMKAVLARARRLAEPVSLVMVDIDKFKKINLDHGRQIGDLALAEFAALVMEGRRSQDVFCRFGGEEFVLMLPGTPEEGADLVAARIKSRIEKASMEPGGVPVKLTISMGVVTARGDDLDADGMLDVVDRRMHNAQKLLFETIETA
jgi:diguanylate cyclase (GGDEF)-like protein